MHFFLSDPRRFLSLVAVACTALVSNAITTAGDVSRKNSEPQAVFWNPVARGSRGDQHLDAIVKHNDTTAEVVHVDGEAPFIDEAADSTMCDESQYFSSGGICDSARCCGSARYWANAEYLFWHSRGTEIPALVTTSLTGTSRDQAGVLGQSSTVTLLGDQRFIDDWQSGGRFSVGGWLNECRDIGIEFTFTTLGDQNDSFSASSDQFPILARPFFNVDGSDEDARILGFPGEVSGGIGIDGTTEYDVYELLIRRPISRHVLSPTYLVYGYRSAELDESLRIGDSSQSLSGVTAGTIVQSFDRFRSRNVFHGFEAGIVSDLRVSKCWHLNIEGKVAFGETDHMTAIDGQSVSTNSQGNSTTTAGGLLAQQSNIGTFESSSNSVIQDFRIGLRRYMNSRITAEVGYNVHRWMSVARVGEQIDRSINPTQIPPGSLVGEARPQNQGAKSDYVAQGITFGIECVW